MIFNYIDYKIQFKVIISNIKNSDKAICETQTFHKTYLINITVIHNRKQTEIVKSNSRVTESIEYYLL